MVSRGFSNPGDPMDLVNHDFPDYFICLFEGSHRKRFLLHDAEIYEKLFEEYGDFMKTTTEEVFWNQLDLGHFLEEND